MALTIRVLGMGQLTPLTGFIQYNRSIAAKFRNNQPPSGLLVSGYEQKTGIGLCT
jgi:hypothetical protein